MESREKYFNSIPFTRIDIKWGIFSLLLLLLFYEIFVFLIRIGIYIQFPSFIVLLLELPFLILIWFLTQRKYKKSIKYLGIHGFDKYELAQAFAILLLIFIFDFIYRFLLIKFNIQSVSEKRDLYKIQHPETSI